MNRHVLDHVVAAAIDSFATKAERYILEPQVFVFVNEKFQGSEL